VSNARHLSPSPAATHEPQVPLPGWPDSHARVWLTGRDTAECIAVQIHGVTHHLHSTTAAELYKALGFSTSRMERPS